MIAGHGRNMTLAALGLALAIPTVGQVVAATQPFTITSLSPNSTAAGGTAFNLTVDGVKFTSSSVVQFNGANRPGVLQGTTRLIVYIGPKDIAIPGTASVDVFTLGVGTSNILPFTITGGGSNPVPGVGSLSPNSASVGGPSFALTVNGTNFVNGAAVFWNGASRSTSFVSASQLTASIAAGDIASSGTATVTVFNPSPGGGTSNALFFTVSSSVTAPPPSSNNTVTITSLTPSSTAGGGTAFNLTVDGVNFTSSSTVRWNGVNHSGVRQGTTRLIVYVGPADIAVAGTVPVTVFTPGSGLSNALAFAVTGSGSNPVPSIAALTPSSATAAGTAFTLIVDGGNFVSGSAVRWNGGPRPTTFVSGIRLSATVSAADIAAAGTAAVTVINPGPGGGTSNALTFTVNQATVINQVPSISSLSPSSATVGSPGFTFTVLGANFNSSSSVQWNNGPRATTFVSSSALTVNIPPGDLVSPGVFTVTVYNPIPGGIVSNSATFTVYDAPNRWTPTGFMSQSRENQTQTLLADGKVLAVGGTQILGTPFDLYDPAAGTWSAIGPVFALGGHTATLLPNGKVLLVGGGGIVGSNGPPLLFDPATGTVSPGGTMNILRAGHVATLLQNGTVLVAGGITSYPTGTATAELFDPASGTWVFTGSMSTPRGPIFGTQLLDGRFLVTGDSDVSAEIYTPSSGTWSPTGSRSVGRQYYSMTLLANGKILVAGGSDGGPNHFSSAEIFDPSSGLWAPTGSMSVGRSQHRATLLSNGKVLVAGGYDGNNYLSSAEIFDPVTGTWSPAASMAGARGSHSATLLFSGKVLVAGGATPSIRNGSGTNSAELYQPSLSFPPTAISAISPNSATTGGGAFTLTVRGSNFVSGSVVRWNGSNRTTAFVSGTTLTASILAGDIAASGTAAVTVLNPASVGGVSNGVIFTVNASTLPSCIASAGTWQNLSFSSQAGPFSATFDATPGQAGMDGVVGFSSGPAGSFAAEASIVRFSTRGFLDARNGGAYATDASIPYSAGTVYHFRLAVNIPAHTYSAFVTTGTSAEQLLASNYAFRTEQSTVSALNNLGVLADIGSESVCNLSISTTPAPNPVPLIAALSPSSATAGGPDFTLTVQGSNFISGSVVRWNGSDMTTVFVSGSTLTVSVPAGDISSVGTVMVTVFNPGPGGGLSSASTFTITANGSSDWVDTGSMSTGRFGHTATLLPNGRVLVAGGLGPWVPSFGPTRTSSPQASAEIYDSTSGGFIVISSMTFARTGHTATLLTNGKVLVAGGGTGGPELFDSALGVWSPTGALLTNRSNHTATLLANGKVLVAGGGVASAELYDPSVGTWSPAGVMSAMRSGNTATLLTSGKVLVCGGTSDGSAEVYDPATGSWSAVASMSTSRVNHTATLLPGGKVFVVGGGSASAEIFDPSIGTWSPAAPMSVVHAGFTATLLLDGQVLAAAGDLRSELYDPVLNVWSPPSYMSTIARSNHTATLLPSGKVLVVGGINSGGAMGSAMLYQANPRPSITAISSLSATAGDPGLTLTVRGNNFISGSVVRWSGLDRTTAFVSGSTLTASIPAGDVSSPGTAMVTVSNPGPGGGPSNQTFFSIFSAASPWMATGSMADYRGNHTSVVLGNGKVMVLWIGDRTEIYDPATGAWSPAALMSTARQLASATLLSNGKLLVAGGLVRGQPSVLAELYDPANDTWTPTGSMFSPRYGHAATLLLNGKVLVAGGAYTSAELYDPANGTWTPTGSVPISHVDVPATLLTDGRVLLAGGTGATVNESDIYDPATGTWAPTSPMSTARNGHTVTLLSNGKVLVAGGGANLSAELYDLATASWTLTTPMITSHYQHTATRLLDGRVLIAGGDTTGRSAELYDPVSGVWNSAGSMTVLRLGHRASLLPNGMVLVSGGFPLDPTNPLSSAELYRSTTPAASTSSFVDAFNQPDGLITNQNPASARSSKWLVTNGSLFASGAQGWTGVPDNVVPSTTSANGTGSAIFRALTVPSNIGSDVTVKVTVQSFVSAQPVGNWDGAHVYLRYLDARNYYQLSVYRRDGRAAIKKMLNGIESTFSTPLYGAAPIGTPQSARAVAINNTNGSVTLQLYVNGSLAASAVDTASPLTALGKVGMAGENTNFKFDDFTVAAPAGGTGVAAVLAAPPAALSFAPASQLVKSAYGGRVERIDATGVHVPENALTADSQITVEKAAETRDADAKRLRRLALRIQPATDEIEYMPSSAFFKEPVTVVLAYNPAKIAAAGLKEDELKVYFWNSALGDWDVLPSVVDKNAKTVSALTQHFSVYQVMAPGDGIVVSAGSPAFGLRAAYVFPNPARGTDAVTIRFQVGLADSVEVHVYDLSGRRVHASSGFTLNTGLDDGNGLGAQYTYDHVWNVSGVGSGVYRYVLTAKKSGHPDIHQTGKIGIVK